MRTTRADWLLLLAGLGLALARPRPDPLRRLAVQHLRAPERVELGGEVAYRAQDALLLSFYRRGVEGPLRGAVLVREGRIVEVFLLEAREGLDHAALLRPGFLEAFEGLPARPPVTVDAVSGATISSQLLTDEVNRALSRWRGVDH